jgi:hypothetical protein
MNPCWENLSFRQKHFPQMSELISEKLHIPLPHLAINLFISGRFLMIIP